METGFFEHGDYKKLVVDLIESTPGGGRGKRKALADAIGCQVSHVTSVLSGTSHFSQEQAEAAARFLGLNGRETEFLLLLVDFNRAGTVPLRKFYQSLLDEKREKYSALKTRLKMPDSLEGYQESVYYSSWQFAAVHVLLSIPQFQSREAIAHKLGLTLSRVDEILFFLVETGLCKKEGHEYRLARPLLHLDKTSPLISKHHTNWRLRAMQSFDETTEEALHYSSVVTLSVADYKKVREILARALSEALKVITQSPEEDVAAVCIDLFRI